MSKRHDMTNPAPTQDFLKESILEQPHLVLEDPEMMRALIEANERTLGSNIVDLRGIAMERLEARFERLEDTHRSVIAAAYENLSGTNQIHRAVLRLLEPTDFVSFILDLDGDVADILRVDCVRLILEGDVVEADRSLAQISEVVMVREPGFADRYITQGRDAPARKVTLRQLNEGDSTLYGSEAVWIRSEACLKLQFGPGCLPGLLCLGAEDPHLFSASQGTDLLTFFTGAVERAMRRWLA
ncbi:MAG: DUF484 family protein [Pseudomonadota bacterium]